MDEAEDGDEDHKETRKGDILDSSSKMKNVTPGGGATAAGSRISNNKDFTPVSRGRSTESTTLLCHGDVSRDRSVFDSVDGTGMRCVINGDCRRDESVSSTLSKQEKQTGGGFPGSVCHSSMDGSVTPARTGRCSSRWEGLQSFLLQRSTCPRTDVEPAAAAGQFWQFSQVRRWPDHGRWCRSQGQSNLHAEAVLLHATTRGQQVLTAYVWESKSSGEGTGTSQIRWELDYSSVQWFQVGMMEWHQWKHNTLLQMLMFEYNTN